jgi:hypothetical protein
MTLAEAIETTRIHSVAGLTGDRTALVTARPFRAPHHMISDVGLIGGAKCRRRARCRWPTAACSCWVHPRRAAAMSWRCGGNRSRKESWNRSCVDVCFVSNHSDFNSSPLLYVKRSLFTARQRLI